MIDWLNHETIDSLHLTGGNAGVIAENITIPAQTFVEFDASSKGLGILLKEQGHHLENYIFANVGTGTSLHYFDGKDQQRGWCRNWRRYDPRARLSVIKLN